MSWLFVDVQKYLQNGVFDSRNICRCLPLFAWVGALIGVLRVRGGDETVLRVVAS
jgi:hypothetical protein